MSRKFMTVACLAVACLAVGACGGNVERDGATASGGTTGSGGSGGGGGSGGSGAKGGASLDFTKTPLPPCEPGSPKHTPGVVCNYFTGNLCYEHLIDACACACPKSGASTCQSGFIEGPPFDVFCY